MALLQLSELLTPIYALQSIYLVLFVDLRSFKWKISLNNWQFCVIELRFCQSLSPYSDLEAPMAKLCRFCWCFVCTVSFCQFIDLHCVLGKKIGQKVAFCSFNYILSYFRSGLNPHHPISIRCRIYTFWKSWISITYRLTYRYIWIDFFKKF